MSTGSLGKITDEEIDRVNQRQGKWRPAKPYWRDATRDSFRAFARGVGNTNPLYQDEEYAAKTRYGGLIAFPMYAVSFFRFEGFGASSPGFPGVQGIWSANLWRFYRPVRLGDRITGKAAFWEQRLVPSRTAGRMLDQITWSACVDQGNGKVVATQYELIKRYERRAARERSSESGGEYAGWKRWVYTEEELKTIWDDFAHMQIRGAVPRYWEDVQVGEKLPSLVTMPYTGREIVAFYMGAGAPFLMSNAVLWSYLREHPGLNVPDAETHTPDVPERTHYEATFARHTGAPDMFDAGIIRPCWATTMLTNWAGDDAFLREVSIVARRFNCYGDVTWVNGQVVDKYRKDEENIVKIALVWDNQRYRHGWGHALVSLCSRERGQTVFPPAPADPEEQPYVPVPDDVREALYSDDPRLPFGSRFKRQA